MQKEKSKLTKLPARRRAAGRQKTQNFARAGREEKGVWGK
jgi:hypothetical protein